MVLCGGAHDEQALHPPLTEVRMARRPSGLGPQRWAASFSAVEREEERRGYTPFPAAPLVISVFLQHHWSAQDIPKPDAQHA